MGHSKVQITDINFMIAILTYDFPHKKTQDILLRCKSLGYSEIKVIASPWVSRKSFKPLYRHRPSKAIDISLAKFCNNLGYDLVLSSIENFSNIFEASNFEHILIGGAGILPNNLVNDYNIVNSHPALLPYSKGLDALKWAIYEENPVGVITHFID